MGPLYRGAPPPDDDEPMPDFGRILPTPKELGITALVSALLWVGGAAAGAADIVLLLGGLFIVVMHAVYVVPVFRPILAKRRADAAADELSRMAIRGADHEEPLPSRRGRSG